MDNYDPEEATNKKTDLEKIEILEARINSLKNLKNHIEKNLEAEKMAEEDEKLIKLQKKKNIEKKVRAKRMATRQRASSHRVTKNTCTSTRPSSRRSQKTTSAQNYLNLPSSMTSEIPSMVPNYISSLRSVPSRLARRKVEEEEIRVPMIHNYYYDEEFCPNVRLEGGRRKVRSRRSGRM